MEDKGAENKVNIYFVKAGRYEEVDKVVKTEKEWKMLLTDEQFKILRKKGTERAFTSEYHDSKKEGIYKCAACGTDLFSSKDKFDSGTGWPSFYQPVKEGNIKTALDESLFMTRIEVLCARCDSHIGHVFDDGPPPTYKRYCMNGLALKFESDY